MLDLKNMLIALTAGFLLGGIAAGISVYRYDEATWTASVELRKKEAARILQAETARVLASEREQREQINALEIANAQSKDEVNRLAADYSRMAVKLRDPGRRQSCRCPSGGNRGSTIAADGSAGGELSAEATGFLRGFARDCDLTAIDAQLGHRFARQIQARNKTITSQSSQ